jgi:hypothetical protein
VNDGRESYEWQIPLSLRVLRTRMPCILQTPRRLGTDGDVRDFRMTELKRMADATGLQYNVRHHAKSSDIVRYPIGTVARLKPQSQRAQL